MHGEYLLRTRRVPAKYLVLRLAGHHVMSAEWFMLLKPRWPYLKSACGNARNCLIVCFLLSEMVDLQFRRSILPRAQFQIQAWWFEVRCWGRLKGPKCWIKIILTLSTYLKGAHTQRQEKIFLNSVYLQDGHETGLLHRCSKLRAQSPAWWSAAGCVQEVIFYFNFFNQSILFIKPSSH